MDYTGKTMRKLLVFLFLPLCLMASGQMNPFIGDGQDIFPSLSSIQMFKAGAVYQQDFSLPAGLPTTNLLGYWQDSYGIESDSTIDLLTATGSVAASIDIVGLDWDITNDSLGIPLKTAATLKWIGTPTIDTAFWKYNIYPNTVFNCIDYNYQTFFKIDTQTIGSDSFEITPPRITEIALYSTALAGVDSTTAMTYFNVPAPEAGAKWVMQTGNDATGNGSFSAPWKSIDKADGVVNDTSTIYVKSNNNYKGDASLVYLYNDKANIVNAVGRAVVRTAAASYTHRMRYDTKPFLYRLIYIPSETLTGIAVYEQTLPSIQIDRIYVNATGTGAVGPLFAKLSNSVLLGTYSAKTINFATVLTGNSIIENCYIKSTAPGLLTEPTITGHLQLRYNKIRGTYSSYIFWNTLLSGLCQISIIGNDINVATQQIYKQSIESAKVRFSYNTVYLNTEVTSTPISFSNTFLTRHDVIGNKFIDLNGFGESDRYIVSAVDACININNNLFHIDYSVKTTGAEIFTSKVKVNLVDTLKISGNKILSRRVSGYHIAIGNEATTAYDNTISNPIIEKNYVRSSSYYDTIYIGRTTHQAFISFQKDGIIRYNNLNDGGYGPAIKGSNTIYDNGGIFYNIVKNMTYYCTVSKGVDKLYINNNTIVCDTTPTAGVGLIANTGGDDVDSCVVKNNIIICYDTGTFNAILIEAGLGNKIDYNIYYSPNADLRFKINGQSKTFAEWQALGYDTHSVVLTEAQYNGLFTDPENGDYSLKAGSVAIGAGTDLGTNYKDGLSSLTNWGADDEVPSVVTKQQGAAWDIGAYIH
jgi:hypothetical protein